MIFTKLFGIKSKIDTGQTEFQNLVKELNPKSPLNEVQICAQSYNHFFSDDSPEKLITYPIKKDAIQFLQYLIPAAISVLEQNLDSEDIISCLSSISIFIQKDKDDVPNLYRLTIQILTSTNKFVLGKSESILRNFTNNIHFCEKIINQDFFDIYQIGKSIGEINSNMSFILLRRCIEKTKSLPNQKIINEIKQHFSESSAEHLCLIATIYQYSKTQLDFDAFNQRIKMINNCLCYEILFLTNSSLAKSKILELFQDPNDELGTSLLQLYLKVPMLFQKSSFLIKYLQFVDSKSQFQFFQNVKKEGSEKLKETIDKVLPPWKSKVDGITLFSVLKTSFNSDNLVLILNQILTSPEKEDLVSSFKTVPNFSNLISSLFETIIEPDQFQIEFSHLVQLITSGSTNVIPCLFKICQNNDPVNYIDAFKTFFPQLIEIPDFVAHLPELSDNEMLHIYLLTPEILYPSVIKGLADFLASLSKSGPHEIIDKIIVEKFENSELKNLNQNELTKLSKGLLQKESVKLGSVKIPSLIPKISHFTFSSLSDRYVVGKYLLEKRIIDNDSTLIPTIGVQFLTAEAAYSILSKPQILFELTNTTFPHSPVYQFEQDKQESFLTLFDLKAKFEFRVDQYDQEFTVLECTNPIVKFKNNALFVGDVKFPCILKKWHSISIKNKSSTGSLHIAVDSVHKATVDQTGTVTIGSRTSPPGSTFYVKAPVNFRGQIGKSVIFVDYKGFAYHSPRMNAIPKILSRLLGTDNREEFSLYVNSLLNIQFILNESIEISVLLGFLRQIFIIKHELVTEEVVQVILGLISTTGTIDWTLFKCIFVDYILWSKLHNVLLTPICTMILNILTVQPLDSSAIQNLSLYHFFLDLSIFLNINCELMNKVVFLLSRQEEDKMSAFTIHLLKERVPQSLHFLMENENSIIDTIPIKFIPFTKPKLSIQILRMYSIKCIQSDTFLNFEELEKLVPYFETLMRYKDFWVSLFSIACKCTFQDIQSYRGIELKVPKMIDIIFKLLCKFYSSDKEEDDEIFLETLSDIVASIIIASNVDFLPHMSSFKALSHFCLVSKKDVADPILFDSFEPCRLPIDKSNNNRIESNNDSHSNPQNNLFIYKSEQFLQGKDLWFGLKSDNFSEICDEITKRKLLINISRSQVNPHNQENAENNSDKMRIDKNVIFYENVIKIITNFLIKNISSDKNLMNELLLFGSNVDPQVTMKVHHSIVFSFLRRTKPQPEFLVFLKKMIIAGWWETRLDELLSAISIVSLRVDENDSKTWKEISNIFKCILSLTSDYNRIQFTLYSNSLFHKSILNDISNLMFYLHILLSDSFLSLSKSFIQEIWYNFLYSLGSLNNYDELINLIYGTTTTTNQIPIIQRINEVVNSTSFFTEISNDDEPFCSILKNKARLFYEAFINEQKEQMNDIYENIRTFRNKNKSFKINNKGNFLFNPDLIEEVTKEIEKFAFMVRFNILSFRNESDSFKLWSLLPKKSLNKYQICPSVVPFSVPTLLVPFVTDVDLSDHKSYEKLRMVNVKTFGDSLNELNSSLSSVEVPHCVDTYVSQPFFNISWKLNKNMFFSIFNFYGKITDIDSIFIVNGSSEISSVLVSCESGFFIIVDASINETEDDKQIFIHNQPKSLKFDTFIDNCASNYYGKVALFNGHVVLHFNVRDIFVFVPRDYLRERVAVEVWFVRGFSLFLRFIDKNAVGTFCEKLNQSIEMNSIPSSKSFYSISFSKNFFRKSKKLNEVIESYQKVWIQNKMSNFIYLLILNFCGNRSFSCTFQYPVMPWPIAQRDMSKPMGQQTAERGLKFARNLAICPDGYMYKQLYSNPSIVLHFMQRIQPFTNDAIDSNNGLFDHDDQLFKGLEIEWSQASEASKTDVTELVPEVFSLPEVFMNPNHACLLKGDEGSQAGESLFVLPDGASDPPSLCFSLRSQLDSRSDVEKWIDLVFGAKMTGEKALESLNVFSPCAAGRMATYVSSEAELDDNMIQYGVLPAQLFAKEHPGKDPTLKSGHRSLLGEQNLPIFCQNLNLKAINSSTIEKVDDALFDEGTIELVSVLQMFLDLSDKKVVFNDELFQWQLPLSIDLNFGQPNSNTNLNELNANTVMAVRLSFDRSMIAVVIENGTLIVYRCLTGKNKKNVTSLHHLTTCFLPAEYLDGFIGHQFNRCAVSPHLNLAVEVSKKTVFCFHLSSSKFIRAIEFAHDLLDVQIAESFDMIVGFGATSIEAVTVNGTKIASIEIERNSDEEINCSDVALNEVDDAILIATGMSDGSIRIWRVDVMHAAFVLSARVDFGCEKRVRLVKFAENGSALLAVDEEGRAKMFVGAEGVSGALFQPGAVASCAKCNKKDNHYFECSMCKLYFCQNCVEITDNVAICKNCLERVIRNSSIDII
ncbi:hypothetical protein M9Y10_045942 [Tritrichomonas musculus]|uniref:BEACH domain-containing protein n=1 Tax=Tritrichomonas musculus TaxID=1915356 RepID=A0ABR2JWZ9_9EUKA